MYKYLLLLKLQAELTLFLRSKTNDEAEEIALDILETIYSFDEDNQKLLQPIRETMEEFICTFPICLN